MSTTPNVGQGDTDQCVGGTNNNAACNAAGDCPGGACEGDGVGDACDNCPNRLNPRNTAPTDCNGDGDTLDGGEAVGEQCNTDGDSFGNACDNCPNHTNPDQFNCDGDAFGDVCDSERNCDEDNRADACDVDDDNDGVADVADRCDSTPPRPAGNPPGWPVGLAWFEDGAIRGDVDGDCDVDQDDLDLLGDLVSWIAATTCYDDGVNKLESCSGSSASAE